MPARDRYPMNAEELARQLRVNAKSLRALLRLHNLVPGHVQHKEYRIYQEGERAIWRNADVQALPRH
jgi:DNA-binding transcriptional MerR regulator